MTINILLLVFRVSKYYDNWGEPKRAPLLRVGRLPAYASGVDMYVCFTNLGQQFGQRFRRLARSCDPLKDENSFRDIRNVWRKTWMRFSRRSRRLFEHVDVSFFGTPCHLDRLPILILAKWIPFGRSDKHKKHCSASRKMRGHSGHLLKGRKRRGDQGPPSGESDIFSTREYI